MKLGIGTSAIFLLALAHPASAREYYCAGINGSAYYPEDKNPTWEADALTNGALIISIDDSGDGDVKVVLSGIEKSLVAEGAFPISTGNLERHGFDGLMLWYTRDGILDQYAIYPEGTHFRLSWSTFRSPASGQPVKIASYTAICNAQTH